MNSTPVYPMCCKWTLTPDGACVEVTADTLPGWIAYAMGRDPDWVHLEAGRAVADCYGFCYWTQPWAALAQTLISKWTPEARTDPEWIRAWIEWFTAWCGEMQAKIKADTGMALGEDRATPGYLGYAQNKPITDGAKSC